MTSRVYRPRPSHRRPRHYVSTTTTSARVGGAIVDYFAIERVLNGEAVTGLNDTEKRFAVEQMRGRDISAAEMARRLGLAPTTVSNWLAHPPTTCGPIRSKSATARTR